MIREKELTDKEINTAIGLHDDEAGLQASLGLMERSGLDPQNYQYWSITRHVRAIACLRDPSWLEFSLEDGSNSRRQLRRYKTPSGVNVAVTWFLQGIIFGADANEVDWQERKLPVFIGNITRLSRLLERTITVEDLVLLGWDKPRLIQKQKDLKPLKILNPHSKPQKQLIGIQ